MTGRTRIAATAAAAVLLLAAEPDAVAQPGYSPRPAQPSVGPPKAKTKKAAPSSKDVSFINRGFDSFNIVAVVDEQVILLEDVLATVKPDLDAKRKMMPAGQFRQYERQRIETATRARIQQAVVLNELKKKLPDPSLMDRIRSAAAGDFERYMNRVAHENNFKNKEELIEQLRKEGTDLKALRESFIDNLVAQQYLNSLIQPKIKDPSRLELEAFYRENPAAFAEPAGVVWRQIEIKKSPDAKASLATIQQIERRLAAGEDFAELAKKYSQGPTAATGGLWSRTSPGSYADPKVDEVLFSIPIGRVSPIVDGKSSYHLILVESRSSGEPKPFVEVQDKVRSLVRSKQIEAVRKQVVDELMQSHHVVTAFDDAAERTASEATVDRK